MLVWLMVISVLTLVSIPLAWSLQHLLANGRVSADERWLQGFSMERYRPMLRLLTGSDEDFLLRDCGYSKSVIRQMRAERRRIFRAYFRNLTRDFNRLHFAARSLLLVSPVDRPDLSEKLVRARLSFFWASVVIEYRLALHAAGIGTVDVRGLFGSLEALRADCSSLLAVQPSAA